MTDGEYPNGNCTVYVLRLEGDNYYVGMTRRELWRRLNEHFNGHGAEWTARHEPIELVEAVGGVSKQVERLKTIEWMYRKGWENVRGGAWTQCERKHPPSPVK